MSAVHVVGVYRSSAHGVRTTDLYIHWAGHPHSLTLSQPTLPHLHNNYCVGTYDKIKVSVMTKCFLLQEQLQVGGHEHQHKHVIIYI